MSMSSHLLERGISFWKIGQQEQARKIFAAIIYNNRQNEDAWIWYMYSLATNREKIAALETFLNIFPDHSVGKKALEKLKAEAVQREAEPAKVPAIEVKPQQPVSLHRERSIPVQTVQPPIQQTRSLTIPWAMAFLGLCFLIAAALMFISRYDSLHKKYQALVAREAQLSINYGRLNMEYQSLSAEKDQLVDSYNALVAKYNTLVDEYAMLRGNYDTLYAEHTSLIDRFNTLSGDYTRLDNIAVKPPYIVVHDRLVETTFYDTNGQLVTWSTPFATLEYDIQHGNYMRQLIVDDNWQATVAYNRSDESILIRDFSAFVTPGTFENVIPDIYWSSASPYEFIYRLWYMLGQLSHYTSEEEETPRYSLETLLAGGGDCEDLSILLASMIKAAPVDWYVDLVYVDSVNINAPEVPDHVVVYVDTGYETFIVETTNNQVMLPYADGVTGWLAENLVSDFEDHYPVWLP